MGFKYLACEGITRLTVTTRGYLNGNFELKNAIDGESLGSVKVCNANIWTPKSGEVTRPDGVHAMYLVFRGSGSGQVKSFRLD